MKTYHPLRELTLARLREFLREPEAVFWTYGFPLMLAVGLGIAFRDRPAEIVHVDVEQGPRAGEVVAQLAPRNDLVVTTHGEADCRERLRESELARARVDDILQRAAGRHDPVRTADARVTEPGSRYIDFVIPGLLGMNLMGGSMWGVGFVIVDMRLKKLLKRLAATPMTRADFLWSLAGSRLLFMLPELLVIMGTGVLLFGMPVRGSWLAIFTLAILGAVSFAGLGMLAACRADRIETVSGLMNVIMVPMWLLSGTFFSSARFPDLLQPFIQALPLTLLNHALRAVILEGASLASQGWRMLALAGWGLVPFGLSLKWFRWH
ncbi:MAG: ABC transporter permease [Gammaproteobacteria bacterium]|nr:ABC transporter permease [Gammaproteobacteria bacterium]